MEIDKELDKELGQSLRDRRDKYFSVKEEVDNVMKDDLYPEQRYLAISMNGGLGTQIIGFLPDEALKVIEVLKTFTKK